MSITAHPNPRQFYGTEEKWPSTIDVEYSETNFCESNAECAGTYCDTKSVPNKCAPKALKHFTTLRGGDYLAPTYDA